MEEVVGSIPTRSTKFFNRLNEAGAHRSGLVSWFVSEPTAFVLAARASIVDPESLVLELSPAEDHTVQ